MNIYIDAGAYTGDTVDCEELFNFKADYKIAFEANRELINQIKGFDEVHNKAVWTKDGTMTFMKDLSDVPMGSTLMQSKTTGRLVKETVKTIDFAKVIRRFSGVTMLVKLDIEGGEFPVLEHLIETGTDVLIHKLYVETHENKVPEYTTTYKDNLLSRLSCEVFEWH